MDDHLSRIIFPKTGKHLRKWLKSHDTLGKRQKMARKKPFVCSNIDGNGFLGADGGEQWQFRLHFHPGAETPGIHCLGKEALSDLFYLRP